MPVFFKYYCSGSTGTTDADASADSGAAKPADSALPSGSA